MGEKLTKARIEELARVAWENTGDKAPVVQPGKKLVFADTGKELTDKELHPTWEDVGEGSKAIYRRQAAAVAVALGYELAEDVDPKPRNETEKP